MNTNRPSPRDGADARALFNRLQAEDAFEDAMRRAAGQLQAKGHRVDVVGSGFNTQIVHESAKQPARR